MENPSRLRWGLVGTGGFADAVFAPALRNVGQELLGAAGSSPQGSVAVFAVRHGLPRTYESLEAMLRDPDVDAVLDRLTQSPPRRARAHGARGRQARAGGEAAGHQR